MAAPRTATRPKPTRTKQARTKPQPAPAPLDLATEAERLGILARRVPQHVPVLLSPYRWAHPLTRSLSPVTRDREPAPFYDAVVTALGDPFVVDAVLDEPDDEPRYCAVIVERDDVETPCGEPREPGLDTCVDHAPGGPAA